MLEFGTTRSEGQHKYSIAEECSQTSFGPAGEVK